MKLRKEIAYGLLSNYSYCCIVWYLIRRAIYMDLLEFIVGKSRASMIWYRVGRAMPQRLRRSWHIFCPICEIKSLFDPDLKRHYSKCPTCGWIQYKKTTCFACELTERKPYEPPIKS